MWNGFAAAQRSHGPSMRQARRRCKASRPHSPSGQPPSSSPTRDAEAEGQANPAGKKSLSESSKLNGRHSCHGPFGFGSTPNPTPIQRSTNCTRAHIHSMSGHGRRPITNHFRPLGPEMGPFWGHFGPLWSGPISAKYEPQSAILAPK